MNARQDQLFLMSDPADPLRISVAITLRRGESIEHVKEVMWNAYLTWHKANDREIAMRRVPDA